MAGKEYTDMGALSGQKIATVFGGTGFVGTQVVRELAAQGYVIKVATRVPASAYFLRPAGDVGQIVPFSCDYSDPASVAEAVKGADVVVNCIGILYERGKRNTFENIHVNLPETIAKAAKQEGVRRFVHISALGCDVGISAYARSKLAGEKVVRKAFKDVVILRPGVIFGVGDDFFNKFAQMARLLRVLPLIGGGKTKLQPVFVGDVAAAVSAVAASPDLGEGDTRGKTYELGGPDVVDLRGIYEIMFSYTRQKVCLVNVPFALAKIQAVFLSLLPTPLLTRDQVESLKTDSVVAKKALTLADLGVEARAMAIILPTYLESYRPGGRFGAEYYAL